MYQVVASLNPERQAGDTPLDLEPLLQHASEFLNAMELIENEKLQYSLQLDLQCTRPLIGFLCLPCERGERERGARR
jgi:hypothetical protein